MTDPRRPDLAGDMAELNRINDNIAAEREALAERLWKAATQDDREWADVDERGRETWRRVAEEAMTWASEPTP